MLHPYFTLDLDCEPTLASFPGCNEEFYANVGQILQCRGHSKKLHVSCRELWKDQWRNKYMNYRVSVDYRYQMLAYLFHRINLSEVQPSAKEL